MRIGINALYLIPGKTGGMSAYLKNLLKYLQEIDTTNEYFIYTSIEGAGTFNLSAGNFHEIRCSLPARLRALHYFWELFILPFQVWKDKIDLLHSPANIAPIYLSCKSIITIHDVGIYLSSVNLPRVFTFTYKKLLPLMVRRASRIITVSEHSKKTISSVLGLSVPEIVVIPLAAEAGEVHEEIKKDIKTKYNIKEEYIFTLIAAIPHKNMDGLIHAYKILTERRQEVPQLVIAGIRGPAIQKVKKQIEEWGLEKNIIFLGFVPDSHLPSLYSSAKLFVFPSKFEGFGLPILEAMGYGVPVVSSNTTSLPEVIGDAGLMFNPDDPAEMADVIEHALVDTVTRKNLVEKGLKRVKEFSWRKVAEKTLAEYKAAMASGD